VWNVRVHNRKEGERTNEWRKKIENGVLRDFAWEVGSFYLFDTNWDIRNEWI